MIVSSNRSESVKLLEYLERNWYPVETEDETQIRLTDDGNSIFLLILTRFRYE